MELSQSQNEMTASPTVEILIRTCEERDVAAITAIYSHHVANGIASFEIDPPGEDEIRRRRRDIINRGFSYLVAEHQGEVVGYAYASPYRLRPAYRYTAENSVYLHPSWTGRGIGRQLMSVLLADCEARGLRQIVAVIGDSANQASIALHRRLGFVMVGTIRSAGYKFGRWVDTVLMQRSLGDGDRTLP
jgi:L-amino acid N-acyltransferase YncA